MTGREPEGRLARRHGRRGTATPAAILAMIVAAPAVAASDAMPVAARVKACLPDGGDCRVFAVAAGDSLGAVLTRRWRDGEPRDVLVELPAGTHELPHAWRIDGRRLPSGVRSLKLRGAGAGETRLRGSATLGSLAGLRVSGGPRVWSVELPHGYLPSSAPVPARDGPAYPLLFDASGPLDLSRWPVDGWGSLSAVADSVSVAGETRVVVDGPAREAAWPGEHAWVWAFFRWDWYDEQLPIERADPRRGELALLGRPHYGVGSSRRARVLNVPLGDVSGVYRLEPGGRGLRVATRDAAGDARRLRLARLAEPLLTLERVRNLTVSGIAFEESLGDGIHVDDAESVELVSIEVRDVGRHGIVVDGGRQVRILDATIDRVGQDGVRLAGGERASLTPSGHALERSRLSRTGQRFIAPTAAVFLQGVGASVRQTSITDCPHMAIRFEGNDHVIADNYVARVVLATADAGAIYSGRDWTWRGNVVQRNVVAHVRSTVQPGSASAIYLDDMLSGTLVEGNLLFDVDRGVLIGGGRDNVVSANLFVRNDVTVHVDDRGVGWAAYHAAPDGTLPRRLAAVPYRSARWRAAYPALARIQGAAPAEPRGNVVTGSSFVSSGELSLVGIARELTRVEPLRRMDVATAGGLVPFIVACRDAPACRDALPGAAIGLASGGGG